MIYPYHIPTEKEVEQIIINKNHIQELISGMETLVSFFENRGLEGGDLNITEIITNFLRKSYGILNKEKIKHTVSNIILEKQGIVYYLQTFFETSCFLSSVSLCYFYEYDEVQAGIPEGFYIDNVNNIIRAVRGTPLKTTPESFEITKRKLKYTKTKDNVVFLLSLNKEILKKIVIGRAMEANLRFQMKQKISIQDLLLMRIFSAIDNNSKVVKLSIEDLSIIG